MIITAELWQANLIALVSAFVAIKVLRPIAIYMTKDLKQKDLKQADSP